MDCFAGLDVSVKETSVCIVDDAGKIVREARVASEPEALLQVLTNTLYRFKRVGLEAGPLSQWLLSALAEAGLPVICVETRHMRAVLKKSAESGLRSSLSISTTRFISSERRALSAFAMFSCLVISDGLQWRAARLVPTERSQGFGP